jgi:hypothetical protein
MYANAGAPIKAALGGFLSVALEYGGAIVYWYRGSDHVESGVSVG